MRFFATPSDACHAGPWRISLHARADLQQRPARSRGQAASQRGRRDRLASSRTPANFFGSPERWGKPRAWATPRRQAVATWLVGQRPSASRPQPNGTRPLSRSKIVDFLRRPERDLPRRTLAKLAARPNNCRSKDAAADGAEPLRNAANETYSPNAAPWLTYFVTFQALRLGDFA